MSVSTQTIEYPYVNGTDTPVSKTYNIGIGYDYIYFSKVVLNTRQGNAYDITSSYNSSNGILTLTVGCPGGVYTDISPITIVKIKNS